ncbi:hypothetical protein FB451DRAFT_1372088 [Mycena latifolia]|nr:hypothetical protein FB451DRAFT_1372088 [Mycena latifolia]
MSMADIWATFAKMKGSSECPCGWLVNLCALPFPFEATLYPVSRSSYTLRPLTSAPRSVAQLLHKPTSALAILSSRLYAEEDIDVHRGFLPPLDQPYSPRYIVLATPIDLSTIVPASPQSLRSGKNSCLTEPTAWRCVVARREGLGADEWVQESVLTSTTRSSAVVACLFLEEDGNSGAAQDIGQPPNPWDFLRYIRKSELPNPPSAPTRCAAVDRQPALPCATVLPSYVIATSFRLPTAANQRRASAIFATASLLRSQHAFVLQICRPRPIASSSRREVWRENPGCEMETTTCGARGAREVKLAKANCLVAHSFSGVKTRFRS